MTPYELYDVRSSNGTGSTVSGGGCVSVYRAFEQIQDGRQKRGVRYSSALILTLIVLAKLAGMTSCWDSRMGAVARRVVEQVLPNPRELPMCGDLQQCGTSIGCPQVTQVLKIADARGSDATQCGDPGVLDGQAEGSSRPM